MNLTGGLEWRWTHRLFAPAIMSIALVCAYTEHAYAADSDLARLPSFDIVVEQIDSNSCGLTKGDVETEIRFVLAQSRIKVTSSAPNFIYVNVNSLDDCSATNVNIRVVAQVRILTSGKFTIADIWNKATLLTGASTMQQRVLDAVSEIAKNLVVEWSSVN